jgi:renalase
MKTPKPLHVGIVGAGMAGAMCARTAMAAGHAVHVFDKSRGPGGRLATRRFEWVDRTGAACSARLDHGAIGITARSVAFQAWVEWAIGAGWLAGWEPRWATDGSPAPSSHRLHVPVPDMPALCRHLLEEAEVAWSTAVDELRPGPLGWEVLAGGQPHPTRFDAVILALPPAQAVPLLQPHRPDWARAASTVEMQPCWTLIGVADDVDATTGVARDVCSWDLARPHAGTLATVMRSDARPGRARVPGQAPWIVHARADWSRQHLEQPAAWVQRQMQAALDEYLGRRVEWQHSVVHRWRHALPPVQGDSQVDAPTDVQHARGWWDADQSLGVCGDFLGGTDVDGVEGAWRSAQSLCRSWLQPASGANDAHDASPESRASGPADVARMDAPAATT